MVKQTAVTMFHDWVGLALLAIGISFPMHQFFGGLFLALAGASFARKMSPEANERELWVVALGAAFFAILAAEGAKLYWPDDPNLPIPMIMGVAGFVSRYVARATLRAAGLLETKTDDITTAVLEKVLPGLDKEDHK